jgi:hypothetical protein
MTRDQAEATALRALAWMAGRDGVLEAFLASSGASPDELRECAADPAFLVAVLDHLMSGDSLVVGFCDHEGVPYDTPARARQALPGGEAVHWT